MQRASRTDLEAPVSEGDDGWERDRIRLAHNVVFRFAIAASWRGSRHSEKCTVLISVVLVSTQVKIAENTVCTTILRLYGIFLTELVVLPVSLPVVVRLLRSGFNATAENSAEATQGLNSLERSNYVVVTGTVTDSDRVASPRHAPNTVSYGTVMYRIKPYVVRS